MGAVVARGDRVSLARPRARDEGSFLAAVAASRSLHGEWVRPPATPEAYRSYLARLRRRNQAGYLARRTDDGALVGVVNISEIVGGSFQSGYLGYYAFAGHTGQGLQTEAVGLVVAHAFSALALHRLEANIQPGNDASRRLAQRCGFRLEGYSPDYLFIAGAWRDHERWAILAP